MPMLHLQRKKAEVVRMAEACQDSNASPSSFAGSGCASKASCCMVLLAVECRIRVPDPELPLVVIPHSGLAGLVPVPSTTKRWLDVTVKEYCTPPLLMVKSTKSCFFLLDYAAPEALPKQFRKDLHARSVARTKSHVILSVFAVPLEKETKNLRFIIRFLCAVGVHHFTLSCLTACRSDCTS